MTAEVWGVHTAQWPTLSGGGLGGGPGGLFGVESCMCLLSQGHSRVAFACSLMSTLGPEW